MADNEKKGVFITVPAKISASQESVREWDFTDDDGKKREMAEITLAKGTSVNGQDASYYKFNCTKGQLDPGGQNYPFTHSILLPEANSKTGEAWNVKLTRDFGKKDADGVWQSDVKEITCTTTELQAACKEQYAKYKEYRENQKEAKTEEKSASLKDEAKEARAASAEQSDPTAEHEASPPVH